MTINKKILYLVLAFISISSFILFSPVSSFANSDILETKILEIKDGNNNTIQDGDTLNTNDINLKIEAKNEFDVDGVICNLDQEIFDDCEIFDDPITSNEEDDVKDCKIKEVSTGEDETVQVEICTFIVNVNNFSPGQHNFSVASFTEEQPEPQQFTVVESQTENIDPKDRLLEYKNKLNAQILAKGLKDLSDTRSIENKNKEKIEKILNLPTNSLSRSSQSSQSSFGLDLSPIPLISQLNSKEPLQPDDSKKIINSNIPEKSTILSNKDVNLKDSLTVQHEPQANSLTLDTSPATFTWSLSANTVLNSAIDSNNKTLIEDANTESNSIQFAFSAESGGEPIEVDEFICSLDGQDAIDCSTGIQSYDNLEFGHHEFKVHAIIHSEDEEETKDSLFFTPAEFNWNIFPDTLINNATDGGNLNVSNQTTTDSNQIELSFSSNIENKTNNPELFECSIDDGVFSDCSDGRESYSNLTLGKHSFKVKTLVEIDDETFIEDPTPALFIWKVEPNTVIESAIDGKNVTKSQNEITESNQITFKFFAETGGQPIDVDAFLCSIDGLQVTDCSDGLITFKNLELGSHNFEVRAIMDDGEPMDQTNNNDNNTDEESHILYTQATQQDANISSKESVISDSHSVDKSQSKQEIKIATHDDDSTSAIFDWSVAPNTVIDSSIDGTGVEIEEGDITTSSSTEFTFSADSGGEPVIVDGFKCKLDDHDEVDCSSNSILYENLTLGKHTFQVTAFFKDGGNIISDPTPEVFNWFEAPDTIIISDIDGNEEILDEGDSTTSNSIEFTYSALFGGKPVEVDGFICAINGQTPIQCNSNEQTFDSLSSGIHTFSVSAFILIGEETVIFDPSPDTFTWTINNSNNNNDINNNNNNDNNNNNNNDNNNNNNNDINNNNNNDINNNNNNDNNNDGTYSSGNSPSSGGGKVANEADPSQQGDESGSNENSPGSVDGSPSSVGSNPADGMQIQPSVTLSGLSGISMGQISQNLDLNVVNPNKISDDCRKKYGTALPSQYIFTINQTATTNANPINISKYYEEMGGKIMDVYNMTYFKGFSIIINDNTLLEKLKNDPRLDLFDQNIYGISLQNNNNNSDKNNFNSDNSGNNTSFQKSTNGCELDYNKLTKLSKNLSTVQNNYTSKLSTISNNTITSPKIPEIDIAVIDTGISYDHPDLNIYKAVSFVNGSTSANDDLGHGTHVAGVIGARDDGVGISGIIPNAKLWALKVCDYRGLCKISDQIKAIEYVTKNADQIDIVNISIENTNSELLNKAINASIKEGVVYVVAAGNQRINSDQTTPANNPNVITVSAIGDSDGKCGGKGLVLDEGRIADDSFANFSNFGNSITIAAPGVDIFSTYNGTGYAIESGTSMAAPHVTGLAGLIKMKNQNATIEEIKDMILTSSIQPGTLCSSDGDKGYFSGDMDQNSEPLIYLGYNKPVIELPNGFNLTNLVEINAIDEINTASNSTNMVPMNMTNLNTDTTRTFINSTSNSGQVISTNTNTIQTQSINNSTNLINK